MSQHVKAIYENGVLRPLEPLKLEEDELVSLAIDKVGRDGNERESVADDAAAIELQRRAHVELSQRMASLPVANPSDGFSSEDHDLALYGWKK